MTGLWTRKVHRNASVLWRKRMCIWERWINPQGPSQPRSLLSVDRRARALAGEVGTGPRPAHPIRAVHLGEPQCMGAALRSFPEYPCHDWPVHTAAWKGGLRLGPQPFCSPFPGPPSHWTELGSWPQRRAAGASQQRALRCLPVGRTPAIREGIGRKS